MSNLTHPIWCNPEECLATETDGGAFHASTVRRVPVPANQPPTNLSPGLFWEWPAWPGLYVELQLIQSAEPGSPVLVDLELSDPGQERTVGAPLFLDQVATLVELLAESLREARS